MSHKMLLKVLIFNIFKHSFRHYMENELISSLSKVAVSRWIASNLNVKKTSICAQLSETYFYVRNFWRRLGGRITIETIKRKTVEVNYQQILWQNHYMTHEQKSSSIRSTQSSTKYRVIGDTLLTYAAGARDSRRGLAAAATTGAGG